MLLILHLNVLLSGEGAFLLNLIHQPKTWKWENHIGGVPSWGPRELWADAFLLFSFLLYKNKKKEMWISEGLEGEKRNSSSYRSLVSWIDTILGGISTFLSVFPKGAPPGHLIDISLSEAPRCIPSEYLQMKRQAQTASLLPLVSILLVCALLAVKAGTKRASVWV